MTTTVGELGSIFADPAAYADPVAFLAERIPHFEVFTIPDAGHHAHRRAPRAFADLVRRGIERSVSAA